MSYLQKTDRITVLLGFSLLIDVVLFDQLTKWLMIERQYIPLWEPWLSLMYMENRGIAFSLPLEGLPQQIITVVLILALVIALVRYKTWQHRWVHLSLMLIIGGAIGNAIDRLGRGYVVDFLQVGSFPVFNIADTCVTLGVLGILLYEMWLRPKASGPQTMSLQSHTPPSKEHEAS